MLVKDDQKQKNIFQFSEAVPFNDYDDYGDWHATFNNVNSASCSLVPAAKSIVDGEYEEGDEVGDENDEYDIRNAVNQWCRCYYEEQESVVDDDHAGTCF